MSDKSDSEAIYYDKDWVDRRTAATKNLHWFTGKAIRDQRSQTPSPDTGQPVPLYPLAINVIGPQLSLNRSVTLGSLPNYDDSPIQIRFRYDEKMEKDAESLKTVFERILRDSYSTSMLSEAMLMMQIDGGTVLKSNWEPKSDFLKYHSRIVRYRPHQILAEYDLTDPWRLRKCYIGWEISAADAKKRYSIDVSGSKPTVVYLEEWDPDEYKITVDGKVPAAGEYGPMQGKHGIGRVPIVYIPHVRSGEFEGNSHVPDMIGVTIELNDRYADIGDAVAEITHPVMIGTDLNKSGGIKLTPIIDQAKRIVRYIFNIGDTIAMPNAKTPSVEFVQHSDIPASVGEFTESLHALSHSQGSMPKAATGDQNRNSGRITGPVTLSDMFEIVAHSQVERGDISEGLRQMVDIELRQLMYHQDDLGDTDLPKLTKEHLDGEVLMVWNPQLPLEAKQEAEMINMDVEAGTSSIGAALLRKHTTNPKEEEVQIWKDLQKKAEIEASAQIKIAKMGLEADKAANDQKVQQQDELHKQQMGFNEDKHALDLKHKEETHKTRLSAQKQQSQSRS